MELPWRPAPGLLLLVGLAAAAIVLGWMQAASAIVAPAVLALLLTIAVQPIRAWLVRISAPAWLRVLLPLSVVLVFLAGMLVALTLALTQLINLLPQYSTKFLAIGDKFIYELSTRGVRTDELLEKVRKLDPSNLVPYLQSALGGLLSFSSLMILLVTLLVAMALDAAGFGRQLDALAHDKPELVRALRGCARDTYSYLKVSTIFGALMAVLDVILLYVLDVPLPLMWGLLAFLANYIPSLGFLLALVPPALLALLVHGPGRMVAVIVAYVLINFVTQSLLLPKFLSGAVGLSVTLTMFSLVLWGTVLGPLGALLAVPLTLMVRALLLDPDPGKRWAGRLLTGADPRPDLPDLPPSDGPVDAA